MTDILRVLEGRVQAACAWCGKSAYNERLVEYGRVVKKGMKVTVVAHPRYLPCCEKCHNHLPVPVDQEKVKRSAAAKSGHWRRKQEKLC